MAPDFVPIREEPVAVQFRLAVVGIDAERFEFVPELVPVVGVFQMGDFMRHEVVEMFWWEEGTTNVEAQVTLGRAAGPFRPLVPYIDLVEVQIELLSEFPRGVGDLHSQYVSYPVFEVDEFIAVPR